MATKRHEERLRLEHAPPKAGRPYGADGDRVFQAIIDLAHQRQAARRRPLCADWRNASRQTLSYGFMRCWQTPLVISGAEGMATAHQPAGAELMGGSLVLAVPVRALALYPLLTRA